MKLYDEGAYEWLSSIAVGGTGADQQMTKPKANSFEELNEERKREGRFMQARILGLVLQGYERTQIGEFIGCSRSTLDCRLTLVLSLKMFQQRMLFCLRRLSFLTGSLGEC